MIPLFFQVVLSESASKAGARLVIPSLATPIGGLVAGLIMSRWGHLAALVRTGAFLMTLGNLLVMMFQFQDAAWKYVVYLFPANLGQGMAYPGILFTSLSTFDHSGKFSAALICSLLKVLDHAVVASTVYLVRSLGTVWGVAITSAITQNVLKSRLPAALSGVPDKWTVSLFHYIESHRKCLNVG